MPATENTEGKQQQLKQSLPESNSQRVVHRGEILHLLADPVDNPEAIEFLPDGALVVADGHIEALGQAQDVIQGLPDNTPIIHHHNALITPGFIDCHVHYPQYQVIASYGTQLLEWLNTHTYPEEMKFSDQTYARQVASSFLDELLSNGTTTALVFGTVHPESVDAFFDEARRRNLRMICGKVMMDRNAPTELLDTAEQSAIESEALIKRWHRCDRLGYAVTPRFAPTSTPEQLTVAAHLLDKHPGVMLHTHLAENTDECAWVKELFPEQRSYLDVYDHYGLLSNRSLFAHSIELDNKDWQRIKETGSSIAHCPLSNLFIGSGLFNMQQAFAHDIKLGFGTDVGGGDSFSILRTINEAYKIQQLQGMSLDPLKSFYLSTQGGAIALSLDKYIGNFNKDKEADFNIIDYNATPLIRARLQTCTTLQEKLFVLQMLGDDRAIRQTWVAGNAVN